MATTAYREVDFGSTRAGLTTVGYALKGFGGAVIAARTTAGVVQEEPGIYGALVTFPDGFVGRIVWDTGEATPLYASDVIGPAAAAPAPAADPYILAIQRGDVVEVGQGADKSYTFLDVDTGVGRVRFDSRPGGGRVVTLDPV